MTDPEPAARTLTAGLAAAPDDFDHPEYEQLAALVDGQLDGADREWIEGHLEFCETCRDDVADLTAVRISLVAQPQRRWITPAIGLGAVAASLLLVVWMGGRGSSPGSAPPEVASVPPAVQATTGTPPAASLLTADEQRRVTQSLESGRLELPANIDLLRGRTGTLLGAEDAAPPLAPLTPVGTAITAARPRFSWTAMAGATAYSVAVFDERFNEVAKSTSLTETTWTPGRDLPRGQMLAWQITAQHPGGEVVSPAPPQPEARFFVLAPAVATSVAAARSRLVNEPVALGLALAKAGLFADASRAFEQALTDSRYDPAQVRALIARLNAR